MSRFTSRVGRWLLIVLACVGLLDAAGHASNWVSTPACRRHLVRRALREMSWTTAPGTVVYVGKDEKTTRDAIAGLGMTPTVCRYTGSHDPWPCYPSIDVGRVDWPGPYVLRVEWGYMRGHLSGRGRATTFLNFFGLLVPITETETWVS